MISLGLSESVSFPSMHAMISRWSLPEERSRMSGVIYAGMSVGTVVSMPLSGEMKQQKSRSFSCVHFLYALGFHGLSCHLRQPRVGGSLLLHGRGWAGLVSGVGNPGIRHTGAIAVHAQGGDGAHCGAAGPTSARNGGKDTPLGA